MGTKRYELTESEWNRIKDMLPPEHPKQGKRGRPAKCDNSLICPALALEDPQPHARAALVVYGDTGEVLYDFNARQKMYPASVTKIMTSLVVLDAVAAGEVGMDTPVTVSAWAVDLPWGSSTAELKVGEVLTIEQLLYCDLLPSGNDACNVLSEAVGGTMAEFVARMNAKADRKSVV